jgi:thiamine kinase-like enzyme
MVPSEHIEPVTRALREAFGVGAWEDISTITRGQTPSLVYRIVVRGSPYLLKIVTRAEDQTRHYTNMTAAAEAGVSPRVRYANVPDKISITDFVDAQPLPIPEARVRIPAFLRTLHAIPPFPKAPFNTTCTFLLDPGPALDGFLEKFRALNLLPAAETDEFFARYAELSAVYPYPDTDLTANHNDLFKPDNILFDGQRVWLVDWEASFGNDPYADLAVVANQLVADDEEELAFLQQYFGAAPDPYQRARFHLMRQLANLFYTMAFLYAAKQTPAAWSSPVPDSRDFARRMWDGEFELTDNPLKIAFARVNWQRLLENVQQPRYREALAIVADRHSTGAPL